MRRPSVHELAAGERAATARAPLIEAQRRTVNEVSSNGTRRTRQDDEVGFGAHLLLAAALALATDSRCELLALCGITAPDEHRQAELRMPVSVREGLSLSLSYECKRDERTKRERSGPPSSL